jgi:hypothetical protein
MPFLGVFGRDIWTLGDTRCCRRAFLGSIRTWHQDLLMHITSRGSMGILGHERVRTILIVLSSSRDVSMLACRWNNLIGGALAIRRRCRKGIRNSLLEHFRCLFVCLLRLLCATECQGYQLMSRSNTLAALSTYIRAISNILQEEQKREWILSFKFDSLLPSFTQRRRPRGWSEAFRIIWNRFRLHR